MKTLEKFLKKHVACLDGFEFAKDLTLEQFLNTCERGDWILWLFVRTNPNDKRLRTLVAAHCANTVRHLMKDERSINAIDVAIRYGNDEATDEELNDAAYASSAYYAASASSAYYAAYAAAYYAANAAYAAAYAADAYADAAYAAKKQNQKLTADICRKYLLLDLWDQSKIK